MLRVAARSRLEAALPAAVDRATGRPRRAVAPGVIFSSVLDDIFDLRAGEVRRPGAQPPDRRALGVKSSVRCGSIIALNASASVAITVFFIVLCSNAVNFVDGLDGLATGVVGIGAGAFFAYSYLLTYFEGLTRATTSSLITVAIAGACLGFLPHNFFPARMFMGDSGAMLLGLLLATSAISLTGQIDAFELANSRSGLVPTVLPLVLPLAIFPCRSRPHDGLHPAHYPASGGSARHSPTPRLLERGTPARAVLVMYVWSAWWAG